MQPVSKVRTAPAAIVESKGEAESVKMKKLRVYLKHICATFSLCLLVLYFKSLARLNQLWEPSLERGKFVSDGHANVGKICGMTSKNCDQVRQRTCVEVLTTTREPAWEEYKAYPARLKQSTIRSIDLLHHCQRKI